jgi:hypothetical protein
MITERDKAPDEPLLALSWMKRWVKWKVTHCVSRSACHYEGVKKH